MGKNACRILFVLLAILILQAEAKADSSTGACSSPAGRDFRQDMRNFVIGLSQYARAKSPGFVIIPQNGQELATSDGTSSGATMTGYLSAIDGQGREDLFYGYVADDTATLASVTNSFSAVLDIEKANGKKILAIDYATTPANVSNSYAQNAAKGYISIAQVRGLNSIPEAPAPYNANGATNINTLASANNFLYLLNYSPTYSTRSEVLSAIQAANFDVVVMDALFSDKTPFTASEISSLKTKAGGGRRLVISYMSIGEAENYRSYWQPSWVTGNPCWLSAENPNWKGNYKVRYWEPAWQSYIFGTSNAYLDQVLAAGFDGAYLDIIDAFEYFENGTQNNCAASVSSSLVVHIPIVTYSGSNYWADLQYNSADSTLTVTNAGVLNDVSFYSNCTASSLTSDLKLHIPVIMLNNVSYWVDLQYSNSAFAIKGGGANNSTAYPQGALFPLGLYSVDDATEMQGIKYSGWNISQSYSYSAAYLQAASKAQMRVLATLPVPKKVGAPTAAELPALIDAARGVIMDSAGSAYPAWWDLSEEMQWWNENAMELLTQCAALTRQYDPQRRPNYMYIPFHYSQEDVQKYVPYLDILPASIYTRHQGKPYAWSRWRMESTVQAITAAGASVGPNYLKCEKPPAVACEKTPVAVLELFHAEDSIALMSSEGTYHDFWQSLVSGARGILLYSYFRRNDNAFTQASWTMFEKAVTELKTEHLDEMILQGQSAAGISFEILEGAKQTVEFLPYEGATQSLSYPSLDFLSKTWQGHWYLIAVNSHEQSLKARLKGLPSGQSEATVLFENRTVPLNDGTLEDTFSGLGVHIYRQK